MMTRQATRAATAASHHDVVFNPGYQHAERLKTACARAAMDAVGMSGTDDARRYQADYRLERMQMLADSEGLDRWAEHDARRAGLLLDIRASLAALRIALDQTSGTPAASASPTRIPLLPALNRAESALNNYAASLTEPEPGKTQPDHYLFSAPVLLWWLLVLLLAELAALGWLFFWPAESLPAAQNVPPLKADFHL